MATNELGLAEANKWQGCKLTYGHFTTIHPGHIRYLRYAKSLGDKLFVALIGDEGDRTYAFSQEERAEAPSLSNIADAIILLRTDSLDTAIEAFKPKMLTVGSEFKYKKEFESVARKQIEEGGKVEYHTGDVSYSSANLLSDTIQDVKRDRERQYITSCKRQGITKEDLSTAIDSWHRTRLIVIGDTIVDQYAACEGVGLSAEAPVVVVKEFDHKDFVGGAEVVAAQA